MDQPITINQVETLLDNTIEGFNQQLATFKQTIQKSIQGTIKADIEKKQKQTDYRHIINLIMFVILVGSGVAFVCQKWKSQNADIPYYIGLITALVKNLIELCFSLGPNYKMIKGYFCPQNQVAPENNNANANANEGGSLSMNQSLQRNVNSQVAQVAVDVEEDLQ